MDPQGLVIRQVVERVGKLMLSCLLLKGGFTPQQSRVAGTGDWFGERGRVLFDVLLAKLRQRVRAICRLCNFTIQDVFDFVWNTVDNYADRNLGWFRQRQRHIRKYVKSRRLVPALLAGQTRPHLPIKKEKHEGPLAL